MTISNNLSLQSPSDLYARRICLYPLSKDVKGEARLLDRDLQHCDEQDCRTLKADWVLRIEVVSHKPCDSDAAKLLDGTFFVRRLVHAFADGSGENRGLHTGEFRWIGNGVEVQGSMSGITNAGTHRKPAFDDCQKCRAPGYMEGQLVGHVVKTEEERLRGCRVRAAYRFRFDPSKGASDSAIAGTFEGLIICPCSKSKCVDFQQFPPMSHSNPWTVDGCTFEVRDFQDNITSTAEVVSWGAFTGLNANYRTTVSLAAATANIEMTLVHFSAPATVVALDGSGVVVDSQTMTAAGGVPETIHLSGSGMETVVVRAPQNETLILEICTS